jgi:hypothetical protein
MSVVKKPLIWGAVSISAFFASSVNADAGLFDLDEVPWHQRRAFYCTENLNIVAGGDGHYLQVLIGLNKNGGRTYGSIEHPEMKLKFGFYRGSRTVWAEVSSELAEGILSKGSLPFIAKSRELTANETRKIATNIQLLDEQADAALAFLASSVSVALIIAPPASFVPTAISIGGFATATWHVMQPRKIEEPTPQNAKRISIDPRDIGSILKGPSHLRRTYSIYKDTDEPQYSWLKAQYSILVENTLGEGIQIPLNDCHFPIK